MVLLAIALTVPAPATGPLTLEERIDVLRDEHGREAEAIRFEPLAVAVQP